MYTRASEHSEPVSSDSAALRKASVSHFGNNLISETSSGTFTGSLISAGEISFGEEECLVVRLTYDKQYWAVGLTRGSIKFYAINSDKSTPVYSLTVEQETLPCTDIQFVPFQDYFPSEKKHLLVATYASGHARLWHYTGANTKSRLLANLPEAKVLRPGEFSRRGAGGSRTLSNNGTDNLDLNQTMACSCSADGQRFVTGGDDAVIRVYDISKRAEINRCCSTNTADKMDGHVMRICALQYHPRGVQLADYAHIFVSGAWDDSIQIWDDRYGHSIWQYYGPHISGTDALDIDSEQNHIASSSWRRDKAILQVWKLNEEALHDFRNGSNSAPVPTGKNKMRYDRPIAELYQDSISLPTMGYVARWLGPQYILYGGSNGNMLKVIDRGTLNTAASVIDLPNGVVSVAAFVPETTDKKPYRIAFCSGTKLYLTKMEKKI